MADNVRQQPSAKPSITKHPLFPAIVALWFGALFGLGSLAIRPTLIEAILHSTRIDSFVPAVSAPLGTSTRILIAVALAVVGALIGGMLARRITRPKPEVRQRRRGTPTPSDIRGARSTPAGKGGLFTGAPAANGDAGPAGRRRSLAIEEDHRPRDFDELAPLPGGAPQILNVNDFGFEGIADEPDDRPVARTHAPVSNAAAALDLTEFAERTPALAPAPDPAPAPIPVAVPAEQRQIFAGASQVSEPVHQEDIMTAAVAEPFAQPVQQFNPPAAAAPFAPPSVPFAPFAPKVADEATPACENAFQPESEPVAETHAPFMRPDAEAHRPFAAPIVAEPVFEPEPVQVQEEIAPTYAEPAVPAAFAPFSPPAPAAAPEPAAPAPAPALSNRALSNSLPLSAGSAAERIATAELGALSPVELIERLAMSLQRRQAKTAEPAPLAPAVPQAFEPAQHAAAIPQAFAPAPAAQPSPEASSGSVFQTAAAPGLFETAFEPTGSLFGAESHDAADALQTASAAPILREEPVSRTDAVTPVIPMPAALRPISFDDADDDLAVPSFVPPRHIAMPVAMAPAPVPVTPAAPTAATNAPAPFGDAFSPPEQNAVRPAIDETAIEDAMDDESQTLEDGYSSLLSLSRPAAPRPQFVRIEEPEDYDAAIEPAVVFPGQGTNQSAAPAPFAQPAAQPFGMPAPSAAASAAAPSQGAPVRRFDAPGLNVVPVVPAAIAPGQPQGADETEVALRTALASLQRVSGAA